MTTVLVTYAQNMGYFQKQVRQSLEQGAVALESQEAIFQKKMEEGRKIIQPICESKGKLVNLII